MLRRILSFLIPCFLWFSASAFADLQSVDFTVDDNTPGILTNYHITIHAGSGGFVFNYGKIVMPDIDFSEVSDVSFSINGGEENIITTGTRSLGQILIVGSTVIVSEVATVDIHIYGVRNPSEPGTYNVDELKIGGDDIIDYAGDMPTYNFVRGATLLETAAIPSYTKDDTPSYTFTSDKAGNISYGGSCTSEMTTAVVGTNTITFNELEEGTYDDCTISVQDIHENISNVLEIPTFTIDTTRPVLTVIQTIPERTNGGLEYKFTVSEECDFLAEHPTSTLGSVSSAISPTGEENTFTARVAGAQRGGTYSFAFLCRDQAHNVSNLLMVGPFTITGGGGGSVSTAEVPVSGETPTEVIVKGPPVSIPTEPETPKTEEIPAVVPQKDKYVFLVDITPRRKNNEKDVRALQTFLNQYEGEKLSINGSYDAETIAAVNRFQRKYASEILAPWGIDYTTGNVGIYTRKKIHDIMKNS